MEKEFIPYEQALALKELGFDEPCLENNWWGSDGIFNQKYDLENTTKAPLYQQAFRFFREKYGLHHNIDFEVSRGYTYNEAYFFIIKKIKGSISVKIQDNSFNSKEYTPEEWNKKCKGSYEEAELECLKELIEIVKRK